MSGFGTAFGFEAMTAAAVADVGKRWNRSD
jgi:hypothetical protein